MAPPGKKGGKREGWEEMDTSSDQRLPITHTILFVINALALSAVPICLSPPISDHLHCFLGLHLAVQQGPLEAS